PDPPLKPGKSRSLFMQSASILSHDSYGRFLKDEVMKLDAFYALSDLYSFAASAENEFFNLLRAKLDSETKHLDDERHMETSLQNLVYHRKLLGAHAERLQEAIWQLRRHGSPDRPTHQLTKEQGKTRPSGSNLEVSNVAANQVKSATTEVEQVVLRLIDDYEHLLNRARSLSIQYKEGMEYIQNSAMLYESRKAIEQARGVARLTLLAFFFIPLGFTTSFFGMNFQELGDHLMTNLDGMAHHDESSENEPLLPGTRQRKPSVSVLPTLHNPRLIIALLTGVMFLINFGAYMMTMPASRIYEDIICHHYYDSLSGTSHLSLDTPIDEALCKVGPVQAELATVFGGLFVASSVPSLLLSMPYGILADRIGRKPVFILSVVGILLTELLGLVICWWWRVFPLRLIWAMPFTQILGGGSAVASAMLFATVADVAPAESRAQIFLIIMSGSLGAQILGPILSSKLMSWSPWPPMLLGIAIIAVGGVCFLFVPESLHHPAKPLTMSTPVSPRTTSPSRRPVDLLADVKKHLRTILSSTSMLNSTPAMLLLSTFFLVVLAVQMVQLALRDVSARFHWSLAQSGYLMSVRAAIDMTVILVILPIASHLLTRPCGPALSTRAKDYLLALLSADAMVIGCILLAVSPPLPLVLTALAIFSLGTGFMGLCRALLTELVPGDQVASLYAAVGVVEILGSIVGGPVLAKLYGIGLEWGGVWRGGPFWVVAVVAMYCIAALLAARRVEGRKGKDVDAMDAEGDGNTEVLL
ncbi:hypothetical protein V500_09918, partial [Pseudogymnoascus sp. VKM F-4518 (FW-2643)]